MNVPRIHGLVLAGGRSSRMKRDKAAIEFRAGETQLDAAMKLLEGRVARAYVSVRDDQKDDPARARYPRIVPGFDATAFRSSHDGLPEPLCAIYEPSARKGIAAQIAAGRNCPRKFLINAHTQLLEQPNPRALDNVNTVDEYERALSEFSHV